MIKKLLFLFCGLMFSTGVFAQAVPDLQQCNMEVFDLTIQTPIALGGQNPADFSVEYFMTQSDAASNTNPIVNPTAFVGGMSNVIFIRVTNLSDDTFVIMSFMASWDFTPQIPPMADVIACDSYVLPTLPPNALYFTGPNGTGTMIMMGDVITVSMTIYIWAQNGTCTAESSFEVTILNTPEPPVLDDVTACGGYILPELPSGYNYYTMSGGMGDQLFAGQLIIENMTLFVYGESGTTVICSSESVFTITSGEPEINFAPLVACAPDGGNIAEFDLSNISQQINFNSPNAIVSFHETNADASANVNLLPEFYTNLINGQIIYVRVESYQDCYAINELELVVEECTNNTISGIVRFDADANGCDASDGFVSNIQVTRSMGTNVAYSYVNASGAYSFGNVPEGENIITLQGLPASSVPAPASHIVNVTGTQNDLTADFCVTGPALVNDASIIISSWMMPVPGFAMNYVMTVSNIGNTTLSGTATFTYDNSILSYSSATPAQSSQTANTVTFNYTNLAPFSSATFYLNFTVFTPPTVISGDILVVSAATTTDQSDVNLANNTATLQQTVVNSYDPNDIAVHEGPFITEVQADGFLHYTIRFQNMGTAPAVNVRVENELDTDLDWSTFMPIAASHTYNAERTDGDLTFRFNNIMLPAEQDNEPASHGWITYKVKPVADFAEGDIISNVADIYFDFNEAIVTNTVTTQIQQLSVQGHDFAALKLYPNPASGYVYIAGIAGTFEVIVYDIQGKLIMSQVLIEDQPLDVSNVESGIYFVKILSEGKSVTRKLIVR